jgi:hypothetical protein
MAVRLSASRTRRNLLPRNIIILNVFGTHFCQNLSKPQGLVRLEGLSKFKNSPHWGIEPAIFRSVAWCLNHYATACPATLIFGANLIQAFFKFPYSSNILFVLRHTPSIIRKMTIYSGLHLYRKI